jgi:hypothetical protein
VGQLKALHENVVLFLHNELDFLKGSNCSEQVEALAAETVRM